MPYVMDPLGWSTHRVGKEARLLKGFTRRTEIMVATGNGRPTVLPALREEQLAIGT